MYSFQSTVSNTLQYPKINGIVRDPPCVTLYLYQRLFYMQTVMKKTHLNNMKRASLIQSMVDHCLSEVTNLVKT